MGASLNKINAITPEELEELKDERELLRGEIIQMQLLLDDQTRDYVRRGEVIAALTAQLLGQSAETPASVGSRS